MKKAYGGVVINAAGEVLLREPASHYKGQVWTFAKGKPQPGETPEQTALREVLEETGIRARIVERIPGVFTGSTTSNEYFLMSPVENTGIFDAETLSVRWVPRMEAEALITLTQRPGRRRRDLRLLKLAFQLHYLRQSSNYISADPNQGPSPPIIGESSSRERGEEPQDKVQ